jgi:hypothetical protein
LLPVQFCSPKDSIFHCCATAQVSGIEQVAMFVPYVTAHFASLKFSEISESLRKFGVLTSKGRTLVVVESVRMSEKGQTEKSGRATGRSALYPRLRTWLCNAITDAMCQCTKWLRSSPLRGSKSREAGEDSDSWVARSTDQQAQCRRATHDQNTEIIWARTLMRRRTSIRSITQ